MPIDKDTQITIQVAWKGAIELISSGKVPVDPSGGVGEQVMAVADDLFVPLAKRMGLISSVAAVPAPTGSAPSASPDPITPLVTDLNACPECAAAGRNGVLIQNTDPSWRGPEFKCSLQQSKKVGQKWVEAGACEYVDWGRNSKR